MVLVAVEIQPGFSPRTPDTGWKPLPQRGWRTQKPRVSTWFQPWAHIGVGKNVDFAPPSEPDWQFSCISALQLVVNLREDRQAAVCTLVLRRTSRLRRSRDLDCR